MLKSKVKNQKAKPKAAAKRTKPPAKTARAVTAEKIQAPAAAAQSFGLFNLKPPRGAHKPRKILGRGPGSGHGKTSTRGSKGQTSRAGRHFYLGFEGGQSPLIRRMPKRGFTSRFKKEYQIINLKDLGRIKETAITPALLEEQGLIKDKDKLIKVLGDGRLKAALAVQAHAFSKKASQEIINAGGKAEIIPLKNVQRAP